MPTRNVLAAFTAVAIAVAVSGCGSSHQAYPASAVKQFVGDCRVDYIMNISLNGRDKAFCGCVIAKLQKTMSYTNFQRVYTRGNMFNRSAAPNEVIDADNACAGG